MRTFESFLNPKRKPNAVFTLEGFEEPFEMRVVSREDEEWIASLQEEKTPKERMDLMVACSLVTPNLRSKELLQALSQREGRTILDPLEALYSMFATNEINVLFAEYSKLANLTVNFRDKVEEAKN